MVAFIDDHRATYGVESICTVLPIAPSTFFRTTLLARDATRRCARAKRDAELRDEIQRVWDTHQQVYGPRKVRRQLRRERVRVAHCTVRRLMRAMGLIRFGGHLPKGGYDVPTDGKHLQEPACAPTV